MREGTSFHTLPVSSFVGFGTLAGRLKTAEEFLASVSSERGSASMTDLLLDPVVWRRHGNAYGQLVRDAESCMADLKRSKLALKQAVD